MQMDDTNKENMLDLTGENQGKSPTSQGDVIENAPRRITRGASKATDTDSDSEDLEDPEVVTMVLDGTIKQGGKKGAPKSSKKKSKFSTFKTSADGGNLDECSELKDALKTKTAALKEAEKTAKKVSTKIGDLNLSVSKLKKEKAEFQSVSRDHESALCVLRRQVEVATIKENGTIRDKVRLTSQLEEKDELLVTIAATNAEAKHPRKRSETTENMTTIPTTVLKLWMTNQFALVQESTQSRSHHRSLLQLLRSSLALIELASRRQMGEFSS
jgi:hypothetical protein